MRKPKHPPKKVVLFIVEGNSDQEALSSILTKLYKNNRHIKFAITNGDVTSDPETTVSQVESLVTGIVKTYITENKLQKSDMFQVVQIFDMDGAYIPDEAVIRGSSGKFYYTPTNISCLAPGDVITRNEHKRSLMDALLKLDSVYGINYEKYFMSCNLDHVLYDEQNLDADEKLERAYEFRLAFQDLEQHFPAFLEQNAGDGVPKDLDESWTYIKTGLHSLERHTNLHLYFSLHPIL